MHTGHPGLGYCQPSLLALSRPRADTQGCQPSLHPYLGSKCYPEMFLCGPQPMGAWHHPTPPILSSSYEVPFCLVSQNIYIIFLLTQYYSPLILPPSLCKKRPESLPVCFSGSLWSLKLFGVCHILRSTLKFCGLKASMCHPCSLL